MGYLFLAYSVIWILIYLYVLTINKRQKQLEQEVESLKLAMQRVSGGGDCG
ncbi:MAG: hypothetical protein PWQ67_835 [Clostridia bacterium]|jgi:CcmD family protein|nr:hypothetical protein [Clostridia bacterium]MDN5322381.1 hypothetical protein [Clostridia bacterium]